MTKWKTNTNLCTVQIWAEIIIRLESYPVTSYESPMNTVWVEHHKTTITSKIATKYLSSITLYFGEESLEFSNKDVWTHSLCSGFTMEIFIENLYSKIIMIMRRWASNAFLWYIRIQVRNLSKGISTLMTIKHAFYTIIEAEIVNHIPRQDDTEPHRMYLHRRGH